MLWGQLAIKALASGALIAAASEIARRNPGLGGLIVSLPLTSLIALIWLWRDTQDPARIADMAVSSSLYVVASLPAFAVLALLIRKGIGFAPAMIAAALAGMAGYLAMGWLGQRMGWPV